MTFTWVPSHGTQVKRRPRVLKAQFGDGYAQRVGDGINNSPQKWDIRFEDISKADALAIDNYLAGKGGVTKFSWTTPDGVTANFVCEEWSRTFSQENGHQVTATFEQDFAP